MIFMKRLAFLSILILCGKDLAFAIMAILNIIVWPGYNCLSPQEWIKL